MTFSERLKRVREERGLSQTELGKLTKIHPHHISKYENAKSIPSADKLKILATALQVSADYLLFDGQKKEKVEFDNPILKESFIAVSRINKEDQETVMKLINAMILKNQMAGIMKPHFSRDKTIEKMKIEK